MINRPLPKKILMAPYSLSLVSVLLSIICLVDSLLFGFWAERAQGLSFEESMKLGEAFGFLFVLILSLVLVVITLLNGYDYYGSIELFNDKIVFRAPFRKKRVFHYSEIKDVGIDYGTISGVPQFWIYFSKETIDNTYSHEILRLQNSESTMRVQYREKLYAELMDNISCQKVRKQLAKSHSVISLFNKK